MISRGFDIIPWLSAYPMATHEIFPPREQKDESIILFSQWYIYTRPSNASFSYLTAAESRYFIRTLRRPLRRRSRSRAQGHAGHYAATRTGPPLMILPEKLAIVYYGMMIDDALGSFIIDGFLASVPSASMLLICAYLPPLRKSSRRFQYWYYTFHMSQYVLLLNISLACLLSGAILKTYICLMYFASFA